MILGSKASSHAALQKKPSPKNWQDALKTLVTNPAVLAKQLSLSPTEQTQQGTFPLRIPQNFLSRVASDVNNSEYQPYHPLLKQFIPTTAEQEITEGFSHDPVEEAQTNTVPGLIHKYQGRVLLIVSSSCPIHCRYCFRRHFPYSDNRNSRQDWQQAIDYIRADNSIHEVIYSGGDPLSASDTQLKWLAEQLAAIPHLKRLRIHTRYPVVVPERITDECLQWLCGTRLVPTVVIHCNHADELGEEAIAALQKLKQAGVTLLNQSVLLKNINDDINTLINLSEKLHQHGVLPYYLHLLDKVQGAAHFEIPEAQALILYRELQSKLPGYLLPKLVKEEAGETAKTLIK